MPDDDIPSFLQENVPPDTAKKKSPADSKAKSSSPDFLQDNPLPPPDAPSVGYQLWSDVAAIPGSLYQAFKDPKATGKALLQAQANEFSKARQYFDQGNYGEAFGHGMAGALPLLGPAAAQAGEEFATGQTKRGIAHTIELLGPEAFGALKPASSLFRAQEAAPEVERALTAQEPYVDMNLGQKLRNPRLERMARGLRNFPGSEDEANRWFAGQEKQLAERGRSLAAEANKPAQRTYVRPGSASNVEAVQNLRNRLYQRADRLKTAGRYFYKSVERDAAAYKVRVQTGTETVPGPNPLATNTPAGMPRQIPVYKMLESPVELAPLRQGLRPLYEELERSMPEARRANSPAFTALKDIVTSTDSHIQAMDLDRSLSAIKSLARGDKTAITPSQRIAMNVIGEGEKQLATAFKNMSPGAQSRLAQARRLWQSYHETSELVDDIVGPADKPYEAGTVYASLTAGKDKAFETLTKLHQLAPEEVRTIGRTYLEELVDKATKRGGFQRAEGILADWERMGDDTKKLLYGPQLTQQLDDFFLAAKRLAPAAGSQTAEKLTSWGATWGMPLGYIGEFLGGVFSGHGFSGAASGAGLAAGTYLGTQHLGPALMARMLFRPGGARLLTKAISLPVGPALRETTRTLAAYSMQEQREMEKENAQNAGGGDASNPAAPAEETQPSFLKENVPPAAAGGRPQASLRPPTGWKPEWSKIMADVAQTTQVDLGMLHAIGQRESGGAKNPATVRSPKGAIGLMQIMPDTGRQYGMSPKDLEDPRKNIWVAAQELKKLKQRYGNRKDRILEAYNYGSGNLEKKAGFSWANLPQETQNYVTNILQQMRSMAR